MQEKMQIDHAAYAAKVRGMSMEGLLFTIKDCQMAIEAMPEGYKCGYYQDEINYCSTEIHRRANSVEESRNYKKVVGTVEMLIGLIKEKDPESLGTSGSEIILAEVKQALRNLSKR